MGSSESDAAQQGMFNAKGVTLIKEAVNGLVKPPEPDGSVLDTPKISLSNMKSRIDAALMVSGGSPGNLAPCSSDADASPPGPSRRSGRTPGEQSLQPTAKKVKVERPESQSETRTSGDTPRSLRSGRSYTSDSPAAPKTPPLPTAKTTNASVSPPAANKPSATVKTEAPEPLPPPKPAKQATPKAGSSAVRVKQELADPLPGLWHITPKIAEEMKSIAFRHFHFSM
ncbi:uncharacterized protein LOC144114238 [Amblyomma americanum]